MIRQILLLSVLCLVPVPSATGDRGALAAVRQCMQPVTSEIVPAPNEKLGRSMALRSWSDKTRRKHGPDFTSWRIAARKVIGCRPATDGSAPLLCVAYAAPCRIEQVPGQPGKPKQRRLKPGEAIET